MIVLWCIVSYGINENLIRKKRENWKKMINLWEKKNIKSSDGECL